VILKSFFFYIAVTLEAFIFCFTGEYLSAKVCTIFYLIRAIFYFILRDCWQSIFKLFASSLWNNLSSLISSISLRISQLLCILNVRDSQTISMNRDLKSNSDKIIFRLFLLVCTLFFFFFSFSE